MVTSSVELDAVFGALGDPTRRSILERLGDRELTVGEIAEPYRISRPAISKHLRVLERAGLVERQRDGRLSRCTLAAEPLQSALDWLTNQRVFWEGGLDRLARHVESRDGVETPARPTPERP